MIEIKPCISQPARVALAEAYVEANHRRIAEWVRSGAGDNSTHTSALRALTEALASRDRASDACASVQKERDDLREMLGEAARNLDALLTMNDKMNEPPPHGGVLPVDMATVMYACRAFLARYEGAKG